MLTKNQNFFKELESAKDKKGFLNSLIADVQKQIAIKEKEMYNWDYDESPTYMYFDWETKLGNLQTLLKQLKKLQKTI